jgi:putative oxidoreductase
MGVWSGRSERFQPWPSFPKPAAVGMFRRGPSSRPQDQAPQGDRPLMNTAALDVWAPRVLSILRIVAALIFFEHGTQKLLGFPPAANAPAFLSLSWTAGLLELVGGALLILGLWTRPVAFILSGEMAFAYFIGHAPRSFFPLINGGTLAILFCFACLYLSTAGGGPYSVDEMRKK